MKYLLDTHTAIWLLENNTSLSETVRAIIDDVTIPLCVSIVSAWEIAIKISVGKLKFTGGSALFIEKMKHNGVELLTVNGSHIEFVEKLPFIHRDPFDRLIIATAKAENVTIITADRNIQKYDVEWVW